MLKMCNRNRKYARDTHFRLITIIPRVNNVYTLLTLDNTDDDLQKAAFLCRGRVLADFARISSRHA